MKKKIGVFIALCLVMFLTGCSSKSETSKTNKLNENNYLILITYTRVDGLYVRYLYDKETKVMYMTVSSYSEASITPLYNPDGTLRLYKEGVDEDDD